MLSHYPIADTWVTMPQRPKGVKDDVNRKGPQLEVGPLDFKSQERDVDC